LRKGGGGGEPGVKVKKGEIKEGGEKIGRAGQKKKGENLLQCF